VIPVAWFPDRERRRNHGAVRRKTSLRKFGTRLGRLIEVHRAAVDGNRDRYVLRTRGERSAMMSAASATAIRPCAVNAALKVLVRSLMQTLA